MISTRMRKLLALFVLLLISGYETVYATHLMGGSMTYEYTGMVGVDQSYHVTLKIYRYCDASGGGTAPLDFSMALGIYLQDPLNPNDDKNWFATETLLRTSNTFITPPSPGVDCSFNTTVCVEEGIFEADILLPPSSGGYHLMVERCCRNGNIINLSTPGSIGQTYYCFVPPDPVINTSPQFSDIPVPFICTGDTVSIVNNAFDPDGDSLVYSFEVPYSGYSSSANPIPDPQFDNNPYGWSIPPVLYNPGYSMPSPFGAGGYADIDPQTGLTKYYIPNQGFYVVAIEIREYRNGVLIAQVRRDLQLIAIACPPNAVPVISNAGGGGQTNFTITEGQTICFPVQFVDPNGDSLFLTSSGVIFNGAITNPPASLPNANGDGFVASPFCWSTDCGHAQAAPYQFVATVTDNGCPPKVTNQIYSITVNPSPLPPAPAVSINQDPPGDICNGTDVTFTAIPTFGGTNPVYQWQLNGVNVGINSNTYTSNTLVNGDVITVSMTSNSTCVSSNNATSPPVVMVVQPFSAPEVSIAAVPPGPVCAGTNVTFTATPVNPGPMPVYEWTVDGVVVGSNSPTFNSSTLVMANQVSVTLTADPACPAAVSNVINMVVNPVLTPSVLITANNAGAICPGQLVTFQAFPTNGGAPPAYQWQINGVNVGANSNIFTSSTLNNGDNVSVILTSAEACVSTPTAVSNVININVIAPSAPLVSIVANPNTPVCADDNIIFTATPTFGGATPTYQWQVNGVTVFVGSATFATASLNDGDQVRVIMTSSLACVTAATATSNVITVDINPVSTVSTTISISPSATFCPGTAVTFTANVNNGGTNPFYQWQVNGVNSGTNSPTFTTSTLMNQDKIRVVVTSNMSCVSPVNAISNQITVAVLAIVNPTVSIAAVPPGPICAGTNVTFTATPTFSGPTPQYQWTVNGTNVGSGSTSFSSGSLSDGDIVRVELTSSAACPVPPVVSSNQIIMDVNPILTPTAIISPSPSFPVCDGTPVTFNAVVTNEGNAPVYQWNVNGMPAGGNTSSILLPALTDGDIVSLNLTSNAVCVLPANISSNSIVVDMLPYQTPVSSISALPGLNVCAGDSVYFHASGLFVGSNPVYQWLLNGTLVQTGSNDFSDIFNDGDQVQAVLISDYLCLNVPSDSSNILTVNVSPNLTPTASITVNPMGAVCPGDLLTFEALITNGGSAPAYIWNVNGVPVPGNNNPVFASSSLSNGDIVTVQLTSSEVCVTSATALSNQIVVQISPNITPDVTINVVPAFPVCAGDSVAFSTVFTGAGLAPVFEWRINGIPTGATGPVFGTTALVNNDVIDVIMESSAFCALPLTDTSNSIVANIDPLLSPSAVIIANPPGTFCDGQEITYSATGSFGGTNPSFQWMYNGNAIGQNNDTLISSSFMDGDSLQLVYTSSEQCLLFNPAYSNIIYIDRLPPIDPVIYAPDKVCYGTEILVQAAATGGTGGPYTYTWDNGLGNSSSLNLFPASTANYTVTVSDGCSTPRSDSKTIVVNDLPLPDFTTLPLSTTILSPYFEFINNSVNGVAWTWSFGDNTSSTIEEPGHEYNDPGYYIVKLIVESAEGCLDSISKEVFIEDVVIFYVPNAFTPNGDGNNDLFGPVGNAVSGYDMNIFGRWGQPVFNSSGPQDKWDGTTADGDPAPEGTYVYTLKVDNDSSGKIIKGIVNLIR